MRSMSMLTVPALAGLSLLFLGADAPARAENGCPLGYTPWRVPMLSIDDCVPIIYDDEPPAPREPVWENRWGAISIGSTATGGGVGMSVGRKSERQARNVAIKQCESTGGGPVCRSRVFAYHNQCVALSWGNKSYVVVSAATMNEATREATRDCNARTEGCRIYYTACSYPVRIR